MKKVIPLSLLALFSFPVAASAQTNVTAESVLQSVDMAWVMIAAFLVFFMHAGFAMVESGFTRSKNALNILMKNFMTMSIAAVLYFIVGYGIMFGTSGGGIIGIDGFLLSGQEDQIGFFVFQAVFAATCATIISGAVAERIKLGSYLLLTVVMTGFIYPVVGHWVWGGGWLAELGFVDFAGSTVVHLTGALGAVTAVLFLGPRIGKYSGRTVNVIPGITSLSEPLVYSSCGLAGSDSTAEAHWLPIRPSSLLSLRRHCCLLLPVSSVPVSTPMPSSNVLTLPLH